MAKLEEYINMDSPKKKLYFMSFAVGSTPMEVKQLPEKVNFSENPKAALLEYKLENFTLLELIRQSSMKPRMILDRRIKEVVRYVNSSSTDKISKHKSIIINYLNQYIFENIMKVMSNPQITNINIGYLLGLQRYTNDLKSIRLCQRALTRIKKIQRTSGYINKVYQDEIRETYNNLWDSFIEGIENKYIQTDKRGILSGKVSVNDEKVAPNETELEIAAFSKNTKINNLIDILLEYNGKNKNEILKELKMINLNSSDKKILEKELLFDDEELTMEYLSGNYDEVLKLLDSFNKSFSHEIDIQTVDDNFDDQITKIIENFSFDKDIPTIIEWNQDKNIGFYGINDPTFWYMIIIIEKEKPELIIKKFPGIINFKLLGYDEDTKNELISDPKYDYIKKSFEYRGELDHYLSECMENLSTGSIYGSNFSEKSGSVKEDIDWIKDSNNIILGYKNYNNIWYNFIAYLTDANNYILEIRELIKDKYPDITKLGIDELVQITPSLTKKFESENELKEYCNNLIKINEK